MVSCVLNGGIASEAFAALKRVPCLLGRIAHNGTTLKDMVYERTEAAAGSGTSIQTRRTIGSFAASTAAPYSTEFSVGLLARQLLKRRLI